MTVDNEKFQMLRSVQMTFVLLFLLCIMIFVCLFESSHPPVLIAVQTDPTIQEMLQTIQKQNERIEYMSKHPKVVFRCLDDESKIKYPRYASDDLTEIIMDTNDECGNSSITDAVVVVHTSADHFERRARFRKTYSNYSNTKPYRLKVVFLLGNVIDASLKIKLEIENRDYGDTVMGAFQDTYQNLTLKAVMGYRWLTSMCPDVKLLIKIDDDVFFDVRKFFTNYWQKAPKTAKKHSIHCLVWRNAHVGRTGKWKVEKNLFANASYPFPYCAGFFVLVTGDLIRNMYQRGKSIDFFWIDDVFLYGMVPEIIKGVNFFQLGGGRKALTQVYKTYKVCRASKGTDSCPYWATLTDGEKEFDVEYTALFTPISLPIQTTFNKTQVVQNSQLNVHIGAQKQEQSLRIVNKENLPKIV
uniref:Hexosyltransferase n=1 Tax=Arion vulgaris TaxID=1028688 RepID=A0A0B7A977_9EUPU